MPDNSTTATASGLAVTADPAAHPLNATGQQRNVLVFAACTGLQYLAAPVLYVGLTQSALLNRMDASRTVANLPETVFFVMTFTPVLLACLLPGVQYLKPTLVVCYLATGAALALVALALVLPVSYATRINAVILQGAISGAAMPTAIALLWEAIGRGASEKRRAAAVGLAFGAGPFLAFFGSLGSQFVLTGSMAGFRVEPLESPSNFALVFGLGVPAMLLAALAATRLVIPSDTESPQRVALWGGVRDFLSQPVLLWSTVVTILLYVGNTITANMNLYTKEVLSADPEQFAGYQNALRFAFKGLAGFLLGWWLTRSNPRAGIIATGLLFVAAQIWAMFATGHWYLLAFGIYGAGELIGVYAPNYILSASRPRDLRRNMAYVTMMMVPAGPAGALFGLIADSGLGGSQSSAFRLSFLACALILVAGLALAIVVLPPRPLPPD
ncbi:MAG: hypothetical protein EXS05_14210 [Planctomycetaceae bacterium]|nr:hypothetical protein [Planctomycetaceae bacterium]